MTKEEGNIFSEAEEKLTVISFLILNGLISSGPTPQAALLFFLAPDS